MTYNIIWYRGKPLTLRSHSTELGRLTLANWCQRDVAHRWTARSASHDRSCFIPFALHEPVSNSGERTRTRPMQGKSAHEQPRARPGRRAPIHRPVIWREKGCHPCQMEGKKKSLSAVVLRVGKQELLFTLIISVNYLPLFYHIPMNGFLELIKLLNSSY